LLPAFAMRSSSQRALSAVIFGWEPGRAKYRRLTKRPSPAS
jgi:hypothetical protein